MALLFVLLVFTANAQPNKKPGNTSPKLVVGIVIENMRPDYIQRYWGKFQDGGFKKLYHEGAVCNNFKIEQHIQNYASGTATLYTGVTPSTHGIIDKVWYDRLKEKEVNCTFDDFYFTVGGDTDAGKVSPNKLMVNTFGDNLKVFSQGKSKVFSLALNAESAAFSAGHAADGVFWFDNKTGRMISSSFYINLFPDWVRIFNSQGLAEQYAYRNWTTLLPINTYTESLEDEYLLEKGYYNQWNTFPHTITKYVKKANSLAPVKTTPFGNQIIYDFATELFNSEDVGTDNYTDLVNIVFSSMDYENGSFGPASVEMEDIYLRLDQHIANLIQLLLNKYGKNEIIIFLTSNTSASYPVNYLKEEFKLAVGNFSPESAFSLLTSYLNLTYGDEKWIENISGQQVYLNHRLIEAKNINKEKIIDNAATFISQFEGIKAALTASVLEKGASLESANSEVYVSFKKNISGDFCYILEEGWQPSYKYDQINYTDQSHIPLIFFGKNIQPSIINKRHTAIDLAPTISYLMGIPVSDKNKGNLIEGLFK